MKRELERIEVPESTRLASARGRSCRPRSRSASRSRAAAPGSRSGAGSGARGRRGPAEPTGPGGARRAQGGCGRRTRAAGAFLAAGAPGSCSSPPMRAHGSSSGTARSDCWAVSTRRPGPRTRASLSRHVQTSSRRSSQTARSRWSLARPGHQLPALGRHQDGHQGRVPVRRRAPRRRRRRKGRPDTRQSRCAERAELAGGARSRARLRETRWNRPCRRRRHRSGARPGGAGQRVARGRRGIRPALARRWSIRGAGEVGRRPLARRGLARGRSAGLPACRRPRADPRRRERLEPVPVESLPTHRGLVLRTVDSTRVLARQRTGGRARGAARRRPGPPPLLPLRLVADLNTGAEASA